MFCTECGKEIEVGTIFCSNCGRKVEGTVKISPRVGSAGRRGNLILPTKILITAIVIVIIIVGILILRRCSTSSPSATVEAFYKAINKGDFDNAKKYVNPSVAIQSFLPVGEEPSKYINGITEVKVEKEAISGDTARVVVHVICKPELKKRLTPNSPFVFLPDDFKKWERGVRLMLVKENGKWIIMDIPGWS